MVTTNFLLIAFATIASTIVQEPFDWDRPIFGIVLEEVNADSRKELKKSLTEQFEDQIKPGFRADMSIGKDGLIVTDTLSHIDPPLLKNDVLKEVEGQPIKNREDFDSFMESVKPGREYTMNILRPSLVRNRTVYKPMEVKCMATSQLLLLLSLYDTQEDRANRLTHYTPKVFANKPMHIYVTVTEEGEAYQRIVFQTTHGDFEGFRYVRLVSGDKSLFIARTDKERQDSNTIGRRTREWMDRRADAMPEVLKFFKENEEVIMVFGGMDSWREDYSMADEVRDNITLNENLNAALKHMLKKRK